MFGAAAFAEVPFAALPSTGGTVYSVSVVENISLAEVLAAVATFPVSQTESITLADTSTQVTAYQPTATENIGLADSFTTFNIYLPAIVENITLADAITVATAYKITRAEPITVADARTVVTAYKITRAEPITVADARTVVTAYKITRAENLTLSDVLSAPVNFPVSQIENLTLTDASTAVTAYGSSLLEAITLADTSSETSAYSFTATEPITVADSYSSTTDYVTTQTEPIQLDDNSTQETAYTSAAVELLTVADILDNATNFYASLTEPVVLADVAAVATQFNLSDIENISLLTYQTAVTAYTQAPVENVSFFDSTVLGGWITIKDAQDVTWSLVNDSSGQTLPNIRDWVASATSGETTLVIGRPTSGAYYVARKYKQNAWVFSEMPFVVSSHSLYNIRWLEDKFYLVGSFSGLNPFIATSPDGETWTTITAPAGGSRIFDIARNGNTLVVAAFSRVYYSTDSGTSWTSTTRTLSAVRPSILWVEELSKFFVVSISVYSSPDGATWTSVASGGQGSLVYTGLAWSGTELVAVVGNNAGSSSRLQRSSDGVNWTIFGAGSNHNVTKVMWDGTQFLFYGDGNSYNYYIYTGSGNILTANPNRISGYILPNSSFSYSMVIVDGLYVIPGYQNDATKHYFYTSTDLVTFSIPSFSGLWAAIPNAQPLSWTSVNSAGATTWGLVDDSAPTTWQNINTLN